MVMSPSFGVVLTAKRTLAALDEVTWISVDASGNPPRTKSLRFKRLWKQTTRLRRMRSKN